MKGRVWILLTMLLLTPCSQAETWGLPKVDEKQMTLKNTGPVALEIMVNQIINQAGDNFSGTIRLVWADDTFSETARLLRSALIGKGIAPERVLLTPKSGGYKSNAVTGIEVWIRQIVMRMPECDYAAQNYRFRDNETQGCALNNARNSSIINLNDYVF
ncbi:hypothetical protein [Metakosakonia massiliensis]|uniref:Pilus assembly protein CpaD n=1 Tax=Phytobacter massiliensis TaxID=1485952 RepID=A0A6N3EYH8_9ENTR|nr:hypothetical protein [Phytobacter massiliensis]